VLDPFCGCGTTIHAAQKLARAWVGIDITHLAISLIERRLKDAFPGVAFEVHGTPKDLESAIDLARRDKYQFQWWAMSLVDARPYGGKKKGADGGIDGAPARASRASTPPPPSAPRRAKAPARKAGCSEVKNRPPPHC
jgi:hypothetical protein